jgi:alpha-beta hydrolase superfamily lysophospholipase
MWALLALTLLPGREKIPRAEVFTASVQGLHVVVTRPAAAGKAPVLFEVAWLSCDSVEQPKGPEDGFTQLIWDLAASYATVRVDKPEPCADLDFDHELAAYRTAFASIKELEFADPGRVYVVGFSNGGGIAPLVSEKAAGYLVFSGWYKTWLEHMLEHERRRMHMKGLSEGEISDRMKQYATFYDLYLNGRQTPGAVVANHPEFKAIWYDEPARQYGRPASFYWQLQSLNLARAWSSVNAPVLAVHGSEDWIMSADDFALLAAALNARKPGSAEFVEWRGLGHGLYDKRDKYDPALTEKVVTWLRAH